MSILIVGGGIPLTTALIEVLLERGDEVRVVEDDPELITRWRSRGARPARGAVDDVDLITRAAEGARSLVLCDEFFSLATVPEIETYLSSDTRLIFVLEHSDPAVRLPSARQHVILRRLATRSRWGGRRGLGYDAIARLVDAADDIVGEPSLDLDMRDAASWLRLGLDPSGSDA